MSTQTPQVLSRKPNGTSNGTPNQVKVRKRVRASQVRRDQPLKLHTNPESNMQGEQAKGNDASGNTIKPSRGKGTADRRGGSSKVSFSLLKTQNTKLHKHPTESNSAQGAHDGEAAPRPSRSKAQNEGEKLVIRRLPPGMTRDEFMSILGPTWEASKGKVDWFSYIPGKISTEYAKPQTLSFKHNGVNSSRPSPSKPSRPSRAYIHLMRKDDIMPLSQVVQSATWEDAKSTFTNPSLIGPPALDFAIYKKVPGTKRRTDARQGTIDQDPEFMAFLEELANPAPMRESIDVEDADDSAKVEIKVTTTPLLEFLKEKKANRGKDGSGKNSKSGGKGKGGSKDDDTSGKKKSKDSRGDKQDRTSKESVKILTKKAATEQAAEGAKKAASQLTMANTAATNTASDAPKSRRAGIAAAARILQRDLGLSPGSAHRRARHDAAKADADTKTTGSSNKENNGTATDTSTAMVTPTETPTQASKGRPESPVASKSQTGRRTRGGKGAAEKAKTTTTEAPVAQPTVTNPPVILKKKNDAETNQKLAEPHPAAQANTNSNGNGKQATKDKASSKQVSQKKSPSVSANATRAFVKHVNASQGVNDASLREALGSFGTVTLVEIDKRKGFAYVDFSEHDALVKAVAASPVQIGQANVQVLERKDKKPAAAASAATPAAAAKDSNANGEKEKEKEKPSGGRGRRGRGGGKAAASATNGQPAAAPAPASTGG